MRGLKHPSAENRDCIRQFSDRNPVEIIWSFCLPMSGDSGTRKCFFDSDRKYTDFYGWNSYGNRYWRLFAIKTN